LAERNIPNHFQRKSEEKLDKINLCPKSKNFIKNPSPFMTFQKKNAPENASKKLG